MQYTAEPSLHLSIALFGNYRNADTTALLDSGATGDFLNWNFVRKHQVTTELLPRRIPVLNVDGTKNGMGDITHTATLQMRVFERYTPAGPLFHSETIRFLITDIGREDVILGTNWLKDHNPEIDWKKEQVQMT